MTRYIIRRILQAIPLLFIISLMLFILMINTGDPLATMGGRKATRPEDRERLSRQLGLDQPMHMQYLYWLIGNDWTQIDMDGDGTPETPGTRKGVLRGDFGNSLVSRGKAALDIILERLPNTLILMIPAEIIVILVSLGVGIYSALRQYSLIDHTITGLSFVGYSMPIFFIALVSMYIFGVNFKRWGLPYLPTVGMFDPKIGRTTTQIILHMVLPIFSMTVITAAGYSRFVRSQMLEVISEDYIRTARAKGQKERIVMMRHALKNALIPLVTLFALDFPYIFAGSIYVELIFSWPGMGRLYYDAAVQRDYPVLMAVLIIGAGLILICNLLADIAYAYLDPRVRYD